MPDPAIAFGQVKAVGFDLVFIEQAQRHPLGIVRENREVHAFAIEMRAQA